MKFSLRESEILLSQDEIRTRADEIFRFQRKVKEKIRVADFHIFIEFRPWFCLGVRDFAYR